MLKNSFIIFVCCVFFLSGCATNNNSQKTQPSWIENPQKLVGVNIWAVGSAAVHYDGNTAQRKLAIARAIDEIALQKRAKISTVVLRKKANNRLESSQSSEAVSLHEVQHENISTKVLKTWRDVTTDTIYVLVVENKE